MGCNCKQVKQIQNLIPNANHSKSEKKGIKKLLYNLFNGIQNLGIKFLVVIVIAISLPIVFLTLTLNLFFQGKPTIPMPKKIVKNLIKSKNES